MKIYKVTVKKGHETKITYCDFRPVENETFLTNGERWTALYWI